MEGVRLATIDDVPRVAELFDVAMAELTPTRGGEVFAAREARAAPVEDDLAAAVSSPDRELWVGTIDDTIIGYAVAHTERLRDGSTLGIIEDLFVETEARGVGVGEAMMGEILQWCAARGCRGIDAIALPGNRATKNFFEASGFTARMLVMHHRSRPSPQGEGIDV